MNRFEDNGSPRLDSAVDARSWFEIGIDELTEYVANVGHSDVPKSYRTPAGFFLGFWVANRRNAYRRGRLTRERALFLESMPGWRWRGTQGDTAFRAVLADVRTYVKVVGNYPPLGTRTRVDLGAWIIRQRELHRAGRLPKSRQAAFEALPGWSWKPFDDAFNRWLDLMSAYVDTFGDAEVPRGYVTPSGAALGEWAYRQRMLKKQGRLEPRRMAALNEIPSWTWSRESIDAT